MKNKQVLRITSGIETKHVPYVGDELFWESVPSYTIPQSLPHGVALAVNVKGPIDDVSGKEKFVRYVRQYDISTDTFTDRVDCLVDPTHDVFKAPDVDTYATEVTAEDDSTLITAPVVEIVDEGK